MDGSNKPRLNFCEIYKSFTVYLFSILNLLSFNIEISKEFQFLFLATQ